MTKNILAIGAHFDDIELGCGGSIAKHVLNGDNVYAYVATVSGFSNPHLKPVRKNSVAKQEGISAMKVLGVKKLYTGNFKTLFVEFNEKLNIEILKIIEKNKIDLVYSHWIGDIHHDHQAVGRSALHSSRHVRNILLYRSNWYNSTSSFNGNFYVDISETWEIKKKSIMKHKSEMNRTGNKWIKFFHNEAINTGQKINVRYSEVFEVVKFVN